MRGAKHPTKLTIRDLDPRPPQFFSQTDSTLRYMFPMNKTDDKQD
jgi:hypothetical protein